METTVQTGIYTDREHLLWLKQEMDNDFSTFRSHYRDLGEYILPRRPRFYTNDVDKGDRRNQKIINGRATKASQTLRAGMMGGVTSPAKPWVRLTTPDPGLAEVPAVKEWLDLVAKRMLSLFSRSNLYKVLPAAYGEMGTFGISAVAMEEDPDSVIRFYQYPIGSYRVMNDHKLRIRTFLREYKMRVKDIVDKFGRVDDDDPEYIDWSNISSHAKALYENGNRYTKLDVTYCVKPNPHFNPNSESPKHRPFVEYYFESTLSTTGNRRSTVEQDKILEKGYREFFPVLTPRWEVTGEDSYATDCPGMTALGDVKQLQTMEKRKAQAIAKYVNPPMKGPSALKRVKTSTIPGDMTYTDEREGQKGFSPVYQLHDPKIRDLTLDIEKVEQRISAFYFEDLFLMLTRSDRREITAREIEERHEEKLIALGPVLEQINQDLLDPLVENTFQIMLKRGLIPPPPQEIQGGEINVEYISIMHQAQKLSALSGIERFQQFYTAVVANDPSAAAKVDSMQLLDAYGETVSLPPKIVRSDEEAQEILRQQQEAAAAQMKAEQLNNMASAGKTMSETDLQGDSALSRVLESVGEQ